MNEIPLILALDVAGTPSRWIDYEQYCYYHSKELIAWSMGEYEYTLRGGISAKTGLQSTLTMNTIIAIKGKLSKASRIRHAPPLTNKALFRRDRNICAFCGNTFSTDHLTRDHVLPISRGGIDTWNNVVASCGACNKGKGNQTPEEAGMPLLYVPYTPDRSEFLILMNKRILADQMDFLVKHVTNENSRVLLA